ncbi:universal stress protein [Streptomyces mobaraensis]|nr:universal stress protein [Streptomyces mobaraensis]
MVRTDFPPADRVLVGFDGSGPALRALDLAAEEAVRRSATLEILSGWPWGLYPPLAETSGTAETEKAETEKGAADGKAGPETSRDTGKLLYDAGRATLDAAAERVRSRFPGLGVVPRLTAEPAARALVRAGAGAGLTVVGSRGRGGFAGLAVGSVGLRVAAHCAGPLLVVRGPERPPCGLVLVGLASEADADAVRFGFEEARRRGAALRVLHAWEYASVPYALPPGDAYGGAPDRQRGYEEAVPTFATAAFRDEYPDVEAHTEAVYAGAARALVEAGAEADLVVLAAHRPRHALGLRLGPVTHAVLHHAPCPVALVPVP